MKTQKWEYDAVQEWLYEDGNKPFNIRPETHLFDVIIEVTDGDDPSSIVVNLEEQGMPPAVTERFKDYFIDKLIKNGKLKQTLFG